MSSIEDLKKDYDNILQQLSDPELISNWEKFEMLSKKKESLEKIFEKEKEIEEIKNEIEENKEIIKTGDDPELISLAENEISYLLERKVNLEKELENLIEKNLKNEKSKETISPSSAIVEIRAGTGGQEAALFARDLFRMYSKYAALQNWKQKVLDKNESDLGGIKEIIFELKDGDVFSKMQYEGGVHRVQRIPETEKSGRIHTSTATVAVLAKPKKTEVQINPQDLKIETYRASGPGGQYVNKRETAIRITHLPTGLVVTSQSERNQLQNKENAMAILEAKLLEMKEMSEIAKLSEKRKEQIKWAKRAEKIRTYNFPQNRVTDHRIKKSWHNLDKIMEGKLDLIIKDLSESFSENSEN